VLSVADSSIADAFEGYSAKRRCLGFNDLVPDRVAHQGRGRV
jgi:hypothetical protein